MDVNVIPVTTAEYGLSKAARPFNSRLDKRKLVGSGFEPLPDWRDAVRRYIHQAREISALGLSVAKGYRRKPTEVPGGNLL